MINTSKLTAQNGKQSVYQFFFNWFSFIPAFYMSDSLNSLLTMWMKIETAFFSAKAINNFIFHSSQHAHTHKTYIHSAGMFFPRCVFTSLSFRAICFEAKLFSIIHCSFVMSSSSNSIKIMQNSMNRTTASSYPNWIWCASGTADCWEKASFHACIINWCNILSSFPIFLTREKERSKKKHQT